MIRITSKILCLLAMLIAPLSVISQEKVDPVKCLPCLIGLNEGHPAVQGMIEKHKLTVSELGYLPKEDPNWAFNFLKYENDAIVEAGIELKNSSENMLGDFPISSSMTEFKEMHPEIMKKKFTKEVKIDVFKGMDLELTSVKFDWEVFAKPCQITLLIGNYNSKKDEDKFIYAVSFAGKDQYYHIPLCKNFNKTY